MNELIVEVHDWNFLVRYYGISKADLKILMMRPRADRKDLFRQFTKPVKVHCESEVDIYLPIYTDDDWDEHEELYREYFKE